MAEGIPVVSTLHEGIPEAVIHGVTGYLVEAGDCASMCKRIVELASNVEQRRDFGLRGHARITEHFTWDHEQHALLRFLSSERPECS